MISGIERWAESSRRQTSGAMGALGEDGGRSPRIPCISARTAGAWSRSWFIRLMISCWWSRSSGSAAYLGLALGNASPTLGLEGKGITGELRWALESLLDYSVFMGLGFNLGSRRCGAAVFAASFGRKPYGAATPALGGPGARPAAVPAVSRRVGARDDRLGRAVPANGHMASGAAQAPRNQSNQT